MKGHVRLPSLAVIPASGSILMSSLGPVVSAVMATS